MRKDLENTYERIGFKPVDITIDIESLFGDEPITVKEPSFSAYAPNKRTTLTDSSVSSESVNVAVTNDKDEEDIDDIDVSSIVQGSSEDIETDIAVDVNFENVETESFGDSDLSDFMSGSEEDFGSFDTTSSIPIDFTTLDKLGVQEGAYVVIDERDSVKYKGNVSKSKLLKSEAFNTTHIKDEVAKAIVKALPLMSIDSNNGNGRGVPRVDMSYYLNGLLASLFEVDIPEEHKFINVYKQIFDDLGFGGKLSPDSILEIIPATQDVFNVDDFIENKGRLRTKFD